MANAVPTEDPWTTNTYPREGNGVGFDRVVFFSDAVIAIAITLMAVEIGVPEIEEPNSTSELIHALTEKGPRFAAFLVAFAWVAIYWRANHRFTTTLRAMSSRYILAMVVYLCFIAMLPIPAGVLGEYWQNPVAVSFFAIFAAMISSLEVVLFLVADHDGLFQNPPTPQFRRQWIIGSLTPVVAFLVSIPIAFVSTWAAIFAWFALAVLFGWLVSKWLPA